MKKILLLAIAVAGISGPTYSFEPDEIRELLMRQDTMAVTWHREVTYLARIDMGIPGGENWIAEWNNGLTIIYTVNEDKEMKEIGQFPLWDISDLTYFDIRTKSRVSLKFDLLYGIPGTKFINKAIVIGDYNGDGRNEMLSYTQTLGEGIDFWEYDRDQDKMVIRGGIPCTIPGPEGPAPAEFITYQGIEGFKVYQDITEFAPERQTKNLIGGRYRWYFYAWDEARQEFVEAAEIGEDIDFSQFTPRKPEEGNRNDNDPAALKAEAVPQAEPAPPEQVPPLEQEDSTRHGKLLLPAAIITLAVITAAIIIIHKKKKNRGKRKGA